MPNASMAFSHGVYSVVVVSTKMTSGDEKSREPRKHNFSASEVSVLTVQILQSKLTNSVTNQKKKNVWTEITAAVNAVGVEKRTVVDVREKWKNLRSSAKKEFTNYRKESKRTGGGPAPKQISVATSKVISCSRIRRLLSARRDLKQMVQMVSQLLLIITSLNYSFKKLVSLKLNIMSFMQ